MSVRRAFLVSSLTLFSVAASYVVLNLSSTHAPAPGTSRLETTSLEVDAAMEDQSLDGFGATVRLPNSLTPALRSMVDDAVYRQVGLTLGRIDPMLREMRGSRPQNDNSDAHTIDWTGFDTTFVDGIEPELGFGDYQLGQMINTRWSSPWLAAMRSADYQRYLDEAAEQVAAGCAYWRKRFGRVPRFAQLFNEPLSGNGELKGGTTQDLVDIVVRAAEQLERVGCAEIRFVVPSEETEERSYESAAAILSDPRARIYVGAIGYHPYPYGSAYADVRRLLRTSGSGVPDSARVASRRRLRDLAHTAEVPLWMTEVSNGGVDARSYDDFRARAIHIHDELVYADASAYFGMFTQWDLLTHQTHFGSTNSFFQQEGNIVLVENPTGRVHITGIGYAIGHYARWLQRGAIRVEASTRDPLLQVTAFRDDRRRRFVLVLINNAGARRVSVTVRAIGLEGPIRGEQSTQTAYWRPVDDFSPTTATSFDVVLPSLSVTTLAGTFRPNVIEGPGTAAR